MSAETTGLQLRSLLKKSGELEISLVSVPTPEPSADEVVVRIEASPINPSDLGLLIGAADMATATMTTAAEAAVMVIETMTEDTAAVRIVEEDMMIAEVIIPEKVLLYTLSISYKWRTMFCSYAVPK